MCVQNRVCLFYLCPEHRRCHGFPDGCRFLYDKAFVLGETIKRRDCINPVTVWTEMFWKLYRSLWRVFKALWKSFKTWLLSTSYLSVCLSFRQSSWDNSVPTEQIFVKYFIVDIIEVCLKSKIVTNTLSKHLLKFVTCPWIILNMSKLLDII